MIWVGVYLMTVFLGVAGWHVLYEEMRAMRRQRFAEVRQVVLEEVKAHCRQHERVTLADILKIIAP